MKNNPYLKILLLLLTVSIATQALASGGSYSTAAFYRSSGAILTVNSTDTLGSSASPITQLFTSYASTTEVSSTNDAWFATSAGSVGIGTTSPWGLLSVNPNGVSGAEFAVGSSTQTDFVVTKGGFVGVNLPDPARPLQVAFDQSSDTTGALRLSGKSNTAFRLEMGYNMTGNYASIYAYQNAGTAKPIIFNSAGGNIGIGTTTPAALLAIYGGTNTVMGITLGLSNKTMWTFGEDVNDGQKFKIASSSAFGTNDRLIIDTNGKIGVGSSTPTSMLSISNSSLFTSSSFLVSTSTASATSTAFSIDSTGKVSIGTTTTAFMFNLQGTAGSFGLTTATGGTNQVICFKSATGEWVVDTTGSCVVSSIKFKKNVKTLTVSGLDTVMKLRPVTYAPISDDSADYKDIDYGFIAEEAAAIDPHFGRYSQGKIRTIDDRAFLSILVKAVQELKVKNEALETRVKSLEGKK